MRRQSIVKKQLKTGFPVVYYEDRFALCGQPQKEDFKEFKEENWTNIINLRSPHELKALDFDTPEICKTLGLNYIPVPVIVKGDINKEALIKIHDLFSKTAEDQKFVVHCASGARSVIALIAHFIFSSKNPEVNELSVMAEELGLYQGKMLDRLFQIMNLGFIG